MKPHRERNKRKQKTYINEKENKYLKEFIEKVFCCSCFIKEIVQSKNETSDSQDVYSPCLKQSIENGLLHDAVSSRSPSVFYARDSLEVVKVQRKLLVILKILKMTSILKYSFLPITKIIILVISKGNKRCFCIKVVNCKSKFTKFKSLYLRKLLRTKQVKTNYFFNSFNKRFKFPQFKFLIYPVEEKSSCTNREMNVKNRSNMLFTDEMTMSEYLQINKCSNYSQNIQKSFDHTNRKQRFYKKQCKFMQDLHLPNHNSLKEIKNKKINKKHTEDLSVLKLSFKKHSTKKFQNFEETLQFPSLYRQPIKRQCSPNTQFSSFSNEKDSCNQGKIINLKDIKEVKLINSKNNNFNQDLSTSRKKYLSHNNDIINCNLKSHSIKETKHKRIENSLNIKPITVQTVAKIYYDDTRLHPKVRKSQKFMNVPLQYTARTSNNVQYSSSTIFFKSGSDFSYKFKPNYSSKYQKTCCGIGTILGSEACRPFSNLKNYFKEIINYEIGKVTFLKMLNTDKLNYKQYKSLNELTSTEENKKLPKYVTNKNEEELILAINSSQLPSRNISRNKDSYNHIDQNIFKNCYASQSPIVTEDEERLILDMQTNRSNSDFKIEIKKSTHLNNFQNVCKYNHFLIPDLNRPLFHYKHLQLADLNDQNDVTYIRSKVKENNSLEHILDINLKNISPSINSIQSNLNKIICETLANIKCENKIFLSIVNYNSESVLESPSKNFIFDQTDEDILEESTKEVLEQVPYYILHSRLRPSCSTSSELKIFSNIHADKKLKIHQHPMYSDEDPLPILKEINLLEKALKEEHIQTGKRDSIKFITESIKESLSKEKMPNVITYKDQLQLLKDRQNVYYEIMLCSQQQIGNSRTSTEEIHDRTKYTPECVNGCSRETGCTSSYLEEIHDKTKYSTIPRNFEKQQKTTNSQDKSSGQTCTLFPKAKGRPDVDRILLSNERNKPRSNSKDIDWLLDIILSGDAEEIHRESILSILRRSSTILSLQQRAKTRGKKIAIRKSNEDIIIRRPSNRCRNRCKDVCRCSETKSEACHEYSKKVGLPDKYSKALLSNELDAEGLTVEMYRKQKQKEDEDEDEEVIRSCLAWPKDTQVGKHRYKRSGESKKTSSLGAMNYSRITSKRRKMWTPDSEGDDYRRIRKLDGKRKLGTTFFSKAISKVKKMQDREEDEQEEIFEKTKRPLVQQETEEFKKWLKDMGIDQEIYEEMSKSQEESLLGAERVYGLTSKTKKYDEEVLKEEALRNEKKPDKVSLIKSYICPIKLPTARSAVDAASDAAHIVRKFRTDKGKYLKTPVVYAPYRPITGGRKGRKKLTEEDEYETDSSQEGSDESTEEEIEIKPTTYTDFQCPIKLPKVLSSTISKISDKLYVIRRFRTDRGKYVKEVMIYMPYRPISGGRKDRGRKKKPGRRKKKRRKQKKKLKSQTVSNAEKEKPIYANQNLANQKIDKSTVWPRDIQVDKESQTGRMRLEKGIGNTTPVSRKQPHIDEVNSFIDGLIDSKGLLYKHQVFPKDLKISIDTASSNKTTSVNDGINKGRTTVETTGMKGVDRTIRMKEVDKTIGMKGVDRTIGIKGVDRTSGIRGVDRTIGMKGVDRTIGMKEVDRTIGIKGANRTSGIRGLDRTIGMKGVNRTIGMKEADKIIGMKGVEKTIGAKDNNQRENVIFTNSTMPKEKRKAKVDSFVDLYDQEMSSCSSSLEFLLRRLIKENLTARKRHFLANLETLKDYNVQPYDYKSTINSDAVKMQQREKIKIMGNEIDRRNKTEKDMRVYTSTNFQNRESEVGAILPLNEIYKTNAKFTDANLEVGKLKTGKKSFPIEAFETHIEKDDTNFKTKELRKERDESYDTNTETTIISSKNRKPEEIISEATKKSNTNTIFDKKQSESENQLLPNETHKTTTGTTNGGFESRKGLSTEEIYKLITKAGVPNFKAIKLKINRNLYSDETDRTKADISKQKETEFSSVGMQRNKNEENVEIKKDSRKDNIIRVRKILADLPAIKEDELYTEKINNRSDNAIFMEKQSSVSTYNQVSDEEQQFEDSNCSVSRRKSLGAVTNNLIKNKNLKTREDIVYKDEFLKDQHNQAFLIDVTSNTKNKESLAEMYKVEAPRHKKPIKLLNEVIQTKLEQHGHDGELVKPIKNLKNCPIKKNSSLTNCLYPTQSDSVGKIKFYKNAKVGTSYKNEDRPYLTSKASSLWKSLKSNDQKKPKQLLNEDLKFKLPEGNQELHKDSITEKDISFWPFKPSSSFESYYSASTLRTSINEDERLEKEMSSTESPHHMLLYVKKGFKTASNTRKNDYSPHICKRSVKLGTRKNFCLKEENIAKKLKPIKTSTEDVSDIRKSNSSGKLNKSKIKSVAVGTGNDLHDKVKKDTSKTSCIDKSCNKSKMSVENVTNNKPKSIVGALSNMKISYILIEERTNYKEIDKKENKEMITFSELALKRSLLEKEYPELQNLESSEKDNKAINVQCKPKEIIPTQDNKQACKKIEFTVKDSATSFAKTISSKHSAIYEEESSSSLSLKSNVSLLDISNLEIQFDSNRSEISLAEKDSNYSHPFLRILVADKQLIKDEVFQTESGGNLLNIYNLVTVPEERVQTTTVMKDPLEVTPTHEKSRKNEERDNTEDTQYSISLRTGSTATLTLKGSSFIEDFKHNGEHITVSRNLMKALPTADEVLTKKDSYVVNTKEEESQKIEKENKDLSQCLFVNKDKQQLSITNTTFSKEGKNNNSLHVSLDGRNNSIVQSKTHEIISNESKAVSEEKYKNMPTKTNETPICNSNCYDRKRLCACKTCQQQKLCFCRSLKKVEQKQVQYPFKDSYLFSNKNTECEKKQKDVSTASERFPYFRYSTYAEPLCKEKTVYGDKRASEDEFYADSDITSSDDWCNESESDDMEPNSEEDQSLDNTCMKFMRKNINTPMVDKIHSNKLKVKQIGASLNAEDVTSLLEFLINKKKELETVPNTKVYTMLGRNKRNYEDIDRKCKKTKKCRKSKRKHHKRKSHNYYKVFNSKELSIKRPSSRRFIFPSLFPGKEKMFVRNVSYIKQPYHGGSASTNLEPIMNESLLKKVTFGEDDSKLIKVGVKRGQINLTLSSSNDIFYPAKQCDLQTRLYQNDVMPGSSTETINSQNSHLDRAERTSSFIVIPRPLVKEATSRDRSIGSESTSSFRSGDLLQSKKFSSQLPNKRNRSCKDTSISKNHLKQNTSPLLLENATQTKISSSTSRVNSEIIDKNASVRRPKEILSMELVKQPTEYLKDVALAQNDGKTDAYRNLSVSDHSSISVDSSVYLSNDNSNLSNDLARKTSLRSIPSKLNSRQLHGAEAIINTNRLKVSFRDLEKGIQTSLGEIKLPIAQSDFSTQAYLINADYLTVKPMNSHKDTQTSTMSLVSDLNKNIQACVYSDSGIQVDLANITVVNGRASFSSNRETQTDLTKSSQEESSQINGDKSIQTLLSAKHSEKSIQTKIENINPSDLLFNNDFNSQTPSESYTERNRSSNLSKYTFPVIVLKDPSFSNQLDYREGSEKKLPADKTSTAVIIKESPESKKHSLTNTSSLFKFNDLSLTKQSSTKQIENYKQGAQEIDNESTVAILKDLLSVKQQEDVDLFKNKPPITLSESHKSATTQSSIGYTRDSQNDVLENKQSSIMPQKKLFTRQPNISENINLAKNTSKATQPSFEYIEQSRKGQPLVMPQSKLSSKQSVLDRKINLSKNTFENSSLITQPSTSYKEDLQTYVFKNELSLVQPRDKLTSGQSQSDNQSQLSKGISKSTVLENLTSIAQPVMTYTKNLQNDVPKNKLSLNKSLSDKQGKMFENILGNPSSITEPAMLHTDIFQKQDKLSSNRTLLSKDDLSNISILVLKEPSSDENSSVFIEAEPPEPIKNKKPDKPHRRHRRVIKKGRILARYLTPLIPKKKINGGNHPFLVYEIDVDRKNKKLLLLPNLNMQASTVDKTESTESDDLSLVKVKQQNKNKNLINLLTQKKERGMKKRYDNKVKDKIEKENPNLCTLPSFQSNSSYTEDSDIDLTFDGNQIKHFKVPKETSYAYRNKQSHSIYLPNYTSSMLICDKSEENNIPNQTHLGNIIERRSGNHRIIVMPDSDKNTQIWYLDEASLAEESGVDSHLELETFNKTRDYLENPLCKITEDEVKNIIKSRNKNKISMPMKKFSKPANKKNQRHEHGISTQTVLSDNSSSSIRLPHMVDLKTDWSDHEGGHLYETPKLVKRYFIDNPKKENRNKKLKSRKIKQKYINKMYESPSSNLTDLCKNAQILSVSVLNKPELITHKEASTQSIPIQISKCQIGTQTIPLFTKTSESNTLQNLYLTLKKHEDYFQEMPKAIQEPDTIRQMNKHKNYYNKLINKTTDTSQKGNESIDFNKSMNQQCQTSPTKEDRKQIKIYHAENSTETIPVFNKYPYADLHTSSSILSKLKTVKDNQHKQTMIMKDDSSNTMNNKVYKIIMPRTKNVQDYKDKLYDSKRKQKVLKLLNTNKTFTVLPVGVDTNIPSVYQKLPLDYIGEKNKDITTKTPLNSISLYERLITGKASKINLKETNPNKALKRKCVSKHRKLAYEMQSKKGRTLFQKSKHLQNDIGFKSNSTLINIKEYETIKNGKTESRNTKKRKQPQKNQHLLQVDEYKCNLLLPRDKIFMQVLRTIGRQFQRFRHVGSEPFFGAFKYDTGDENTLSSLMLKTSSNSASSNETINCLLRASKALLRFAVSPMASFMDIPAITSQTFMRKELEECIKQGYPFVMFSHLKSPHPEFLLSVNSDSSKSNNLNLKSSSSNNSESILLSIEKVTANDQADTVIKNQLFNYFVMMPVPLLSGDTTESIDCHDDLKTNSTNIKTASKTNLKEAVIINNKDKQYVSSLTATLDKLSKINLSDCTTVLDITFEDISIQTNYTKENECQTIFCAKYNRIRNLITENKSTNTISETSITPSKIYSDNSENYKKGPNLSKIDDIRAAVFPIIILPERIQDRLNQKLINIKNLKTDKVFLLQTESLFKESKLNSNSAPPLEEQFKDAECEPCQIPPLRNNTDKCCTIYKDSCYEQASSSTKDSTNVNSTSISTFGTKTSDDLSDRTESSKQVTFCSFKNTHEDLSVGQQSIKTSFKNDASSKNLPTSQNNSNKINAGLQTDFSSLTWFKNNNYDKPKYNIYYSNDSKNESLFAKNTKGIEATDIIFPKDIKPKRSSRNWNIETPSSTSTSSASTMNREVLNTYHHKNLTQPKSRTTPLQQSSSFQTPPTKPDIWQIFCNRRYSNQSATNYYRQNIYKYAIPEKETFTNNESLMSKYWERSKEIKSLLQSQWNVYHNVHEKYVMPHSRPGCQLIPDQNHRECPNCLQEAKLPSRPFNTNTKQFPHKKF